MSWSYCDVLSMIILWNSCSHPWYKEKFTIRKILICFYEEPDRNDSLMPKKRQVHEIGDFSMWIILSLQNGWAEKSQRLLNDYTFLAFGSWFSCPLNWLFMWLFLHIFLACPIVWANIRRMHVEPCNMGIRQLMTKLYQRIDMLYRYVGTDWYVWIWIQIRTGSK